MDVGKWLDRGLEKGEPQEKTIRMQELAERLGYSNGTYLYRFIKGERRLSKKRIAICAEYFGEPDPSQKLSTSYEVATQAREVRCRVIDIVEAGSFREPEFMSQIESRTVTFERDEAYPNATPMAWEVRGDSMNKIIVDGMIAFGVDFQQTGTAPRQDMIVVIEQNRGGLIERSIKAVALYDDRIEFQPRSYNPAFKPIVYRNRDTSLSYAEVKILTLIRGASIKF